MGYINDNRTPLERIDESLIDEMLDVGTSKALRDIERQSAFASFGDCDCDGRNDFKIPNLSGMPLAMVYSPKQEWECLYEIEDGFKRGTLFKKLDFPFKGSSCGDMIRGRCCR